MATTTEDVTHMRVLLVEDEPRLAESLARGLRDAAHAVDTADTLAAARVKLELERYDAVILDVNLPDGSGFGLAAELRKRAIPVPILMLTARDTVEDRVHGLDSGADDYLVKPFALAELLARVRALGRRAKMNGASESPLLAVADLELDLRSREARRGPRRIELTAREFGLLETLMRHPGQVMTRSQLLDAVWSYDAVTESNVVDIYIHYLRNKLDKGFDKKLIRTVRGMGYAIRAD